MNFFKIKKNKIPFVKPLIDSKEIKSVINVLKSGIYAHGPISNLFEKKFSIYWSKIFHNSIVLHCWPSILFALGIGRGDEVIVPAQTHTATAHAVELAGAKFLLIVIVAQEISIPKKYRKKFQEDKSNLCGSFF